MKVTPDVKRTKNVQIHDMLNIILCYILIKLQSLCINHISKCAR